MLCEIHIAKKEKRKFFRHLSALSWSSADFDHFPSLKIPTDFHSIFDEVTVIMRIAYRRQRATHRKTKIKSIFPRVILQQDNGERLSTAESTLEWYAPHTPIGLPSNLRRTKQVGEAMQSFFT